ncbi:hypothetical protein GDO81_027113 [Engystomops pustulosus]|uniref:Uncharacterized protein n=1 Tax=Engystomops pustulosus TaxID=76066 RepID=A0AAV6YG95_ENGPU|nr:hypothetical protein GDO81_027113 [Engystomops pustulosus]
MAVVVAVIELAGVIELAEVIELAGVIELAVLMFDDVGVARDKSDELECAISCDVEVGDKVELEGDEVGLLEDVITCDEVEMANETLVVEVFVGDMIVSFSVVAVVNDEGEFVDDSVTDDDVDAAVSVTFEVLPVSEDIK